MRGVDLPHVIRNGATITADFNANLHLLAYDYVFIWIKAPSSGGAAKTLDMKVQEAIPRAAATAWVDIANKAITQLTDASVYPATQVIVLTAADIRSEKMRLVVDVNAGASFAGVDIMYQGKML